MQPYCLPRMGGCPWENRHRNVHQCPLMSTNCARWTRVFFPYFPISICPVHCAIADLPHDRNPKNDAIWPPPHAILPRKSTKKKIRKTVWDIIRQVRNVRKRQHQMGTMAWRIVKRPSSGVRHSQAHTEPRPFFWGSGILSLIKSSPRCPCFLDTSNRPGPMTR